MKATDWEGTSRGVVIGAVMLCLAGCASRFLPVEASAANGPAQISGRAYLLFPVSNRQRNCEDILLVPQKAEYHQIVLANFGEDESKLQQDIKFAGIYDDLGRQGDVKAADCDDSGRFAFSNLANGDYYLIARSTWLLRLTPRGGYFFRQIHVPQDRDGIIVSSTFRGG
jgi:hypothetical protein